MRILSPEGTVGGRGAALADSPDLLSGRRLAVLDNGKPGAALVMTHIAERLAERAGVDFVGVHRKRTAATPCADELISEIAGAADLVVTGTADWGSCTSWSLHDTARLEALGAPTVVIATDKFADLARQCGRDVGLMGARIVALEHPVGGTPKDELRRRADAVIEDVMHRLLGR